MRATGGGLTRNGCEKREIFTSLYRRHADGLYRYCLSRTRDPSQAEEALATVFLEAWRRRDEVDLAAETISPWLFGVARNVLRNQHRAQRRQEAMLRSLEPTSRVHADDPSEELERRQAVRALTGSFLTLPDGQRQVVSLCLLSDRSYEAAAGDLEIPVGTVRSRLSRARLNLALAVRTADDVQEKHDERSP